MLGHLDGNRVALVTFAGTAFTRSPLTVDLPTVATLVERSQGDSPLMQAGTDLRVAIDAAVLLLAVADRANAQVIILVSDGEDLGAEVAGAVERAGTQGIAIYTVFSGTETPTALPASSGGTDVTRGDPRALAAIADGTGGTLRDVRTMAGLAVDFRRMRQTQFDTAETRVPHDRFAWFIGAALALLFTQMTIPASGESRISRRFRLRAISRGPAGGVQVAALATVLLLTACSATTGTRAFRHVEEGNRLFDVGQLTASLAEYRASAEIEPENLAVQYNLANALYALGRYEDTMDVIDVALEASPELTLSTRLQFNGGNTAVRRNDLERARAAFQQVLRQDSQDMDAKANLELVLRHLAPAPEPPTDAGTQGQGAQGPPGQPGPDGQPGAQPNGQSGDARDGEQKPGGPGDAGADGDPQAPPGTGTTQPGSADGSSLSAQDAANQALEAALAQLGPEVSPEEAVRILGLAQRANDLSGLSTGNGRGGVPAR